MTNPADQQAEYESAFAQATLPPAPKPIDPMTPLPFYPSARYTDHNLAPEKTLTYGDVTALAGARKMAEANGVLSPELGAHMLPMAMVEGRGSRAAYVDPGFTMPDGVVYPPQNQRASEGDFGVNAGNMFYPKPATLGRFKKMGLSITDLTDPADIAARQYDSRIYNADEGHWDHFRRAPLQDATGAVTAKVSGQFQGPPDVAEQTFDRVPVKMPPVGDMVIDYWNRRDPKTGAPMPPQKMLMPNAASLGGMTPGIGGTADSHARMMAAILSEKHSTNSDPSDVAKSVSLFNGSGRVQTGPGASLASSDQYLAKVQEAKSMLLHTRNAPLMKHFNDTYLKQ